MTYATVSVDPILERTTELLGGSRSFKKPIKSRLDAHDALRRGLPVLAIEALLKGIPLLSIQEPTFEDAIGMSLRTYQRRRNEKKKPLSAAQSNRAWKFAEILARAIEIFGSQDEAIAWMTRPATGLDQRRPIELMTTAAGIEIIEDHLTRLDYGVYT